MKMKLLDASKGRKLYRIGTRPWALGITKNKMINKADKRIRLKKKIRVKIKGTEMRPRLTVFRSNKFIYAQVIDDLTGKTLAQTSDIKITKGTKSYRAKKVGRMIAEVALKEKISKVVFDRNGFKYTGRIKLVADEARAAGLKF